MTAAGLNLDQIKRKAVARGLATPEMMSAMDDADIYNYIFTPGFSTAEKVTDISGRGVGMNVVKEIVSELNGSVIIETEWGMGTRFVLSFPITLAIIPAIMVKVRHEMYAIPAHGRYRDHKDFPVGHHDHRGSRGDQPQGRDTVAAPAVTLHQDRRARSGPTTRCRSSSSASATARSA